MYVYKMNGVQVFESFDNDKVKHTEFIIDGHTLGIKCTRIEERIKHDKEKLHHTQEQMLYDLRCEWSQVFINQRS